MNPIDHSRMNPWAEAIQAPLPEGLICLYDETNTIRGNSMGSSYLHLYYHIVWGTYRRNPWIDDAIETSLEKLIRDKLIVHNSKLLAFGCTVDHLHLAVQLHSSLSVAGIIGEIKGYTSFLIANQIQPELGFRWQGGYGAWTVSQKDLPRLMSYIKNQKERHGQKTIHHP